MPDGLTDPVLMNTLINHKITGLMSLKGCSGGSDYPPPFVREVTESNLGKFDKISIVLCHLDKKRWSFVGSIQHSLQFAVPSNSFILGLHFSSFNLKPMTPGFSHTLDNK